MLPQHRGDCECWVTNCIEFKKNYLRTKLGGLITEAEFVVFTLKKKQLMQKL